MLHLQNALRKAWEGDKNTLAWLFRKHNRASVYIEPSGMRLSADDAWEGACLFFLLYYQAGRIGKCASPDCPAPYFLRARRGQRFCSHRCAVLVSVRHLRQRQKKAMKLLKAVERKAERGR